MLVSAAIGPYGLFVETKDRALLAKIQSFHWNKLAITVFEKGGVTITGYGTALVHKEEVMVPLYLDGEESGPCRFLLKFPLVEASDEYPYDSLVDHLWSSVAHSRYLEAKSKFRVPHIYYFYLEGLDILGGNCPFMLLERISGTPLHQAIANLNSEEIHRVGHQWGVRLAHVHSFHFSTPGALRTMEKGMRSAVDTVGADPDGHHLRTGHYSSPVETVNGFTYKVRDNPSNALEYFFSFANTALIRTMTDLRRRSPTNESFEEWEKTLWEQPRFIHMRHLHMFIPNNATSKLVDNYFVLDMPSLDIGNIHIDNGCISSIVSVDGINIVPAQIALRLPQLFQGFTWFGEDQLSEENSLIKRRNYQRYTMLQNSFASAFSDGLLKDGVLTNSNSPTAADIPALWAAGLKLKNFERLLYRFTGEKDENSVEFQAYLVFARASWDTAFRNSSTSHYEPAELKRYVIKNWRQFKACYPELSRIPHIPRTAKEKIPQSCHCHCSAETVQPKPTRLRKIRSRKMKNPTSSFEFDSPGRFSRFWQGVSDEFLGRLGLSKN